MRGKLKSMPAVLARLNDQERKQYRKQIYGWYRDLHAGKETTLPGNPKAAGGRADQAAALAVLATGTLKEAERVVIWWFFKVKEELAEAVFQVLNDRRPKWATRWLEKRLEGETFFPWELLERLLAEGVCEKPTSDDYIRFLGDHFNDYKYPLVSRLKARPNLLEEDIWRLFEVPSGAFSIDPTNYWNKQYPEAQGWGTAFVELAADGTISREKLLDCALEALARDFNQNVFTGVLNMLKQLKPTAGELGERQAILRELLASPVSHVAKFALASLKRAKLLQVEEYLRAAPPVLQLPVKGNSMTLLKHVAKLRERNPELEDLALPLFELGTLHAHPDVQDYAGSWLAEHGFASDPAEAMEEPEEVELDPESVEPRWRKLLGFEEEGFPRPLAFQPAQVPYLSGLEEVAPIEGLQELIDAVAAGVEEMPTGWELERILGGLSRLCDRRPDDFEERTEALRKRVVEFQASETLRGLVSGYAGVSSLVRHLLLLWLQDTPTPYVESEYYRPINVYPFVKQRFSELFARIAARRAAPMLAEPTHQRGWIEPIALVRRLQDCRLQDCRLQDCRLQDCRLQDCRLQDCRLQDRRLQDVGEADLIQAFLRLAPYGRERALAEVGDLQGWFVEPLRWALGGGREPSGKVKHGEVWLASCRAREPRGELALKALASMPEDSRKPIAFQWETTWVGTQYKFPRLQWREAEEPREGALGALRSLLTGKRYRPELMPTWLLQRNHQVRNWESVDLQSPWIKKWLGLLWPSDLRGYWRLAADCILERLDIDTASTFPNYAWYEPLFEVDRCWGELEYLILCLGLISKDSDVVGLAVDAAIEAIEDGRLHPEPFSRVLNRLCRAEWVKPNRLAATLGEVARVSALQRRIVAEVVGSLLSYPLPKNGHHLLQLMTEVGDGLPAPAREQLEQLSGSGKTAKLARKLLGLGSPTPLSQFRSMALRGRMERAVRWSERKN